MIIKGIEEITIYESPDGGRTVYSRKSGQSERQLIKEPEQSRTSIRWMKFKEIIELSETNETLDNILKQAEITYELIRNRN